MQRFASVLLLALATLSMITPSLAQTTVYFTYYTPTAAATYPAVCGTGSLSCTLVAGTTANYTCSSLISGTHYYYPSATAPTFANAFQTAIPATCNGYTSTNLLPITPAGLNLQYGSTCINLYLNRNNISVSPDARTGITNFTYSTSQSGVATCPTPVTATASGSATVGFVYTITGLTNSAVGVKVCGAGNLQCTQYGNNEYQCPTLLNGVQYVYNGSSALATPTLAQQALNGEVECSSYGDGSLPLNYEGISFGLTTSGSTRNCTSLYTNANGVAISYNVIGGNNTFAYQNGAIDVAAACQAYIPSISVSSSTGSGYTSTGGSTSSSPASYSSSLMTVFALLFVTVLAHGFLFA